MFLGCALCLLDSSLSVSRINDYTCNGGLFMIVTVTYCPDAFSRPDMSRRKLRLGRRKKSLETQKPKVLTVSIPRAAVSVQLYPSVFCSPSLPNAPQHSGPFDQPVTQLTVSLPISLYMNGLVTSVNFLSHRLSILKLPPQWVIASMTPLCLCKVGLQEVCRPSVTLSIAFNASLEWTTTISSKTLNPSTSPVLFNLPYPVKVIADVFKLMDFLGAARFCRGSPDSGLVELWKKGSSSLHISSGMLHKYWCF